MPNATYASMATTYAEIAAKPPTPARASAMENLKRGMTAISEHAARVAKGGPKVRAMTMYDRERLMGIVDDGHQCDDARDRAKTILDGGGELSRNDIEFLDRAS